MSEATVVPSPFEIAFRSDLPAPSARWTGSPKFNFVGGNNAAESLTVPVMMASLQTAVEREGLHLATYHLNTGPQGYRPLREFLADHLKDIAGMTATADDILVTSGSLQGIDLINEALLQPGDTVLIEEVNYGGVLTRLARLGVTAAPVVVDHEGMCMKSLASELARLAAIGVRPKYIYTIPTVQNPSATVLPESRRREMIALAKQHDVPIFEDDCYADLVFDGTRPPAIHALDDDGRVAYLGTFSKSIAPALRVGYVVAPWPLLSRLLSLKTDAGSGALEQLMMADFCKHHFKDHVARLRPILQAKLATLTNTLAEHFGTTVSYTKPLGGIFLWVKFPESVNTAKLAAAAAKAGIAINPGREWSIAADADQHIRICFANPTHEELRVGIAKLADVCFAEFGMPERSGNVARGAH